MTFSQTATAKRGRSIHSPTELAGARSPHWRMDELSPAALRQHSPGVRRRSQQRRRSGSATVGAAVIKLEPLD